MELVLTMPVWKVLIQIARYLLIFHNVLSVILDTQYQEVNAKGPILFVVQTTLRQENVQVVTKDIP